MIVADGKAHFVEVKSATDCLSDNQVELFEALGAAGVQVVIWWELAPSRLIPWRRFRDLQRRIRKSVQSRGAAAPRVRKAPGFDVRRFNRRGQLPKR